MVLVRLWLTVPTVRTSCPRGLRPWLPRTPTLGFGLGFCGNGTTSYFGLFLFWFLRCGCDLVFWTVFLVLFTARILQLRVSGNINSIYIKNHFVTVRRRFSIVTTNKSCPFHNQVRGTKLSERQNFKRQNSQRAEQTAIGYLYIAAKQRDDYSPGLYAISSIFATAFVSSGVTVGEDSPLSTFFKFSII